MQDPKELATIGVRKFEGNIPWMYLDIKGFVTAGCGTLIRALSDALKLGFLDASGQPSRPDAIAKDFLRVRNMAKGRLAAYYKVDSSPCLSQATIDQLIGIKLDEFERGIQTLFPKLPSYPVGVQAGLLLMTYAIGVAGLQKYTQLRESLIAGNWAEAGTQSGINTRNKAYAARNEYTANLFQAEPL